MQNNLLTTLIIFIRNLFKHGNFDKIAVDFDLLTDKGEMSTVNPDYNQKLLEQPKEEVIEGIKLIEEKIPDSENQSSQQEANTNPIKEEIQQAEKTETQSEKNSNKKNTVDESDFDYSWIDDETLKKIYETLHKINEFEKKVEKIRNIKFAKRDKGI